MQIFLFLGLTLAAAVATATVLRWLSSRRHRMLARLLDHADELERLLHTTRERMRSMRAVVDRVPEDIATTARASLDTHGSVQRALRDVLEHRLWIARHGTSASQRELAAALAALRHARDTIAGQLEQLESAGADLVKVTQTALEQATREPPALRRNGDL